MKLPWSKKENIPTEPRKFFCPYHGCELVESEYGVRYDTKTGRGYRIFDGYLKCPYVTEDSHKREAGVAWGKCTHYIRTEQRSWWDDSIEAKC